MKALIIGAGIGGLSTAIALRRIGVDVTVFERAPELTEVGAGISLWANAMRALDYMGAGDAVRRVSLSMVRSEMRVNDGRTIAVQFSADKFERRIGVSPFVAMCHRAELIQALGSCLPEGIVRCGHECTGFEKHNGIVTALFRNGHVETADVLIAADGIKSIVRSQLFGAEPPRYSGYTCWRGVCARPVGIDGGYVGEWWGRGRRFGITTLPKDRVYWFATRTAPAGGHNSDEKAAVADIFRGWADPVPELISSTPPAAVLRNDIVDRPPITSWAKDRVVVLGDAAHPTTPNLGQGGCMAIEDAVVLAQSLVHEPDIGSGLARFVNDRSARTAAVTNESWRFGKMAQWEGRLSCWFRSRLIRLLMPLLGSRSLTKYAAFDVGPIPAPQ